MQKELDLSKPAIDCRSLTKAFRVSSKQKDSNGFWSLLRRPRRDLMAVDDVSFEVPRGEIFGILGPNGSGKSTLIRILSTLVFPDRGSVRLFGADVVDQAMIVRKHINRVSVDAAFFKKLSAWENLSYAARLYGMPVSEARAEAERILGEMGFAADRMNQPLEELSRGMQQKVAIARALFTQPVILLLDEPTTGLDPVSKRQVQDYVLRVRTKQNATVLLTTHDMDEAERMCDRLAVIHNGKFIAMGTIDELKAQVGGAESSLEEVFFKLTGTDLAHADLEDE